MADQDVVIRVRYDVDDSDLQRSIREASGQRGGSGSGARTGLNFRAPVRGGGGGGGGGAMIGRGAIGGASIAKLGVAAAALVLAAGIFKSTAGDIKVTFGAFMRVLEQFGIDLAEKVAPGIRDTADEIRTRGAAKEYFKGFGAASNFLTNEQITTGGNLVAQRKMNELTAERRIDSFFNIDDKRTVKHIIGFGGPNADVTLNGSGVGRSGR
ncbi:MAG: hypothetical protein DRH30_00935 [Deltaproteobacteria bacterium]|nr:MAG: hypothetical protein DRH30_00935 [Deltaproteobacteria bacterium]